MKSPIRVLLVDDSSLVRRSLARGLDPYEDIEVVGAAADPFVARDMIVKVDPQVIVLDIEMPRMDGLTFLRRIMRFNPIPTIIVSSLTPKGAKTALACLEAGAVDVLCKPGASYSLGDLTDELVDVIRKASVTRPRRRVEKVPRVKGASKAMLETTNKVIAIGASTGGTQALEHILRALPRTIPGIVIVQHMPSMFTRNLANRLDTVCELNVREAQDGDVLTPGVALIAPGETHLRTTRRGAKYYARVRQGPRVHQHCPSVDVLFESTAEHVGSNAMGVILTGMGDDGADGMKAMHDAGAITVAQDEASCVVYGMPKEAVARGGVDVVAPLETVADLLVRFGQGKADTLRRRQSA